MIRIKNRSRLLIETAAAEKSLKYFLKSDSKVGENGLSQLRVLHRGQKWGLASMKLPCTFLTPRHAKNPGISWVFWGGIFFALPFWKGRTKKIPTFSSAFGGISPVRQEQYHPEAKTISPVRRWPYHSNGED